MIRLVKKKISSLVCLGLLLCLTACDKYYLSLTDQNVNVNSLASVHAGTPDKRQSNPPYGQRIVIDWRVPKDVLRQSPFIELFVIYGDFTEKKFEYPIDKRMGYVTYKHLNEDFTASKGIISYRANIKLEDGEVYKSWKHQLWVNLIDLSEEEMQTDIPTEEIVDSYQVDDDFDDYLSDDISSNLEEDDSILDPSSKSSFVDSQSIQGSVTDI